MKVRVPVLVKDPAVARFKGVPVTEDVTIQSEEHFLDGPITPWVAVLDFNEPSQGGLAAPAKFLPPAKPDGFGRYAVPDNPTEADLRNYPQLMQVTTFGGAYKTLALFEEEDTLATEMSDLLLQIGKELIRYQPTFGPSTDWARSQLQQIRIP